MVNWLSAPIIEFSIGKRKASLTRMDAFAAYVLWNIIGYVTMGKLGIFGLFL